MADATTEQINAAAKIIDGYVAKGVYKFEDIAKHLIGRLGDKAETIFDAVKKAYALSYTGQQDDAIADKMDASTRAFKYETIKSKINVSVFVLPTPYLNINTTASPLHDAR